MNHSPKFRSPYHTTGADLAAALGMKPRAKQEVHVLTKRYGGGMGERITVLVDGEYYDVRQRTLDALNMGQTPADLELEPADPEDDFNDDYEGK
ncbi:hypothetical protein D3227_04725 [Mesorhizobium waimense]|uniref:Uncharacterized protein n=1 Tax=Mesorhizobium waimense TaxID=1300307 RepID=A0A3A5L326_9HYPH|nr:hypothetical protein [Mesorhizobium waimense]RJT41987.1 hypothetical protein D3227_04725 [Mesorhizobium waimense]